MSCEGRARPGRGLREKPARAWLEWSGEDGLGSRTGPAVGGFGGSGKSPGRGAHFWRGHLGACGLPQRAGVAACKTSCRCTALSGSQVLVTV